MEGRGKDAQAYKHTSASFKCSYETLREVGGHGPASASASASAGAVYPMAICKSTWQHRQRCPGYCVFIRDVWVDGWKMVFAVPVSPKKWSLRLYKKYCVKKKK